MPEQAEKSLKREYVNQNWRGLISLPGITRAGSMGIISASNDACKKQAPAEAPQTRSAKVGN